MRLVARVGVGLALLLAGGAKVTDAVGFARLLFHYPILPAVLVVPVALILPWVELLTGLCLLSGLLLEGAALLAALLGVLFTAVNGWVLFRGLDLACGCFSTDPSSARTSWVHLAVDLLLVAGSTLLCRNSVDVRE